MALIDSQCAYFRSQLGTQLDEADLETRLIRLGDEPAVAREVLDQRLADLLSKPATFAVPGEYSESRAENIKALQAKLEELGTGGTGFSSVVKTTQPSYRW